MNQAISDVERSELSPQYGAASASCRRRWFFSPFQFARTASRNSRTVQARSRKQTWSIAQSESTTLPRKPSVTMRGRCRPVMPPSVVSRRLSMPPFRHIV